jgi:hypothetical protein
MLTEYLLNERELDSSSKPNQQGQKAACQRKIALVRKSYSLYLRVKLQKGVDEFCEDDDE